ncbi:MAG TPA: fibronectin type III domain-containing protein, partial [Desulfosarcina sp.]|nr:fibronectin type III domain-containing protein [Desulfosarcina sp.]
MQRSRYSLPHAAFSVMIVSLVIVLTSISTMAASVTLRWDPNNPTPDGYRVFARKSGQAYNYSQPHWQGKAVTCTINNLQDLTIYYFVVRAFDGSLVSADSQEVRYVPPAPADDSPTTGSGTVPSTVGSADTDGDGMSDEWEIYFGLNPVVDDADGDLDNDGISNRDEYRAGIEPDEAGIGAAPQTPSAVSPAAYSQIPCSSPLVA